MGSSIQTAKIASLVLFYFLFIFWSLFVEASWLIYRWVKCLVDIGLSILYSPQGPDAPFGNWTTVCSSFILFPPLGLLFQGYSFQ